MFVMQAAITIANQTFPELPIPDRHCQCVTNLPGHYLHINDFFAWLPAQHRCNSPGNIPHPGLIVSPTQAPPQTNNLSRKSAFFISCNKDDLLTLLRCGTSRFCSRYIFLSIPLLSIHRLTSQAADKQDKLLSLSCLHRYLPLARRPATTTECVPAVRDNCDLLLPTTYDYQSLAFFRKYDSVFNNKQLARYLATYYTIVLLH